ncbi:hypothetical protein L4D76_26535 [Photobacterium sagamiensis]|uniref:hypothetical protein n=1 Tax=Photobacterium sagamiensis TaxID=2910241 RepID=UPI003D122961
MWKFPTFNGIIRAYFYMLMYRAEFAYLIRPDFDPSKMTDIQTFTDNGPAIYIDPVHLCDKAIKTIV